MNYIIDDMSRTIVLDKFTELCKNSGEKPRNLVQILEKYSERSDDGRKYLNYQELDYSELKVHSFEEFRSKFTPKIYQVYKEDDDGGYYEYVTEEVPGAKEAQIDTLSLYDAAIELYKNKGIDGKDNWSFDYSCFSNLINPTKVSKENKRKRVELRDNMRDYIEAKNNNNSALADKCLKKVLSVHEEIKKTYTMNPVAGLCLNLADLSTKLGYDEKTNKDELNGDTPPLPCMYRLSYNDEGDLVKEKIKVDKVNNDKSTNHGNLLTDKANQMNRYLLESKVRGNEETGVTGFVTEGKHMQDLVINTFTQETAMIDPNDIDIINKYKKQYEIAKKHYVAAQDSLLKAINSMIEKMLDIKALFDNAERDFEVIIANNTVQEILKVEELFEDFIVNVNNDCDSFINFAVLPQIYDKRFVKIKKYDSRKIEKIDDANESSNIIDVEIESEPINPIEALKKAMMEDILKAENSSEDTNSDLCSFSEAKRIMNILQKNQCMTFFGYKACEETGFSKLSLKRLSQYREEMKSLNDISGFDGNYAVFVYPNFTLMSGIQAGNIEVTKGEYIENPGFFIDSSYVALGLVIKSLNADYLGNKERGFERYKIDTKRFPTPCVRFDFEDSSNDYKNRNVVKSNMNCESLKKFDKKILDNLENDPFGFMFDTVAFYNNKKVKNSFVRYSRNFGNNDNRIFATLVKDFIMRDAKQGNSSLTVDDLKKYISNSDWLHSIDEEIFNNPFHQGDQFTCESNNGKPNVSINFAGNEKGTPITDIVVK